MFRPFFVLALCFALPVSANESSDTYTGWLTDHAVTAARQRLLDLADPEAILMDAACCKTCRKGKACGDSCISRDKQCTKGVGCACDG